MRVVSPGGSFLPQSGGADGQNGGGGEMSEEALGGSQVPRSRTVAVG